MDGKNIGKLEKLIVLATKELRRLKSENKALREDLRRRKSDLNKTLKDGDKVKNQMGRIAKLEKENKRLESGQAQVRKKVGNILDELEKADFI